MIECFLRKVPEALWLALKFCHSLYPVPFQKSASFCSSSLSRRSLESVSTDWLNLLKGPESDEAMLILTLYRFAPALATLPCSMARPIPHGCCEPHPFSSSTSRFCQDESSLVLNRSGNLLLSMFKFACHVVGLPFQVFV
jgi:hypothetical protein